MSIHPTTDQEETAPADRQPEFDTAWFKHRLANLKGRIEGLMSDYSKDTGLLPLFTMIISWIEEAWRRFELISGSKLESAAQEAAAVMRNFDAQALLVRYRLNLEKAAAQLRERLYSALVRKLEREIKRRRELSRAIEYCEEARVKVWRVKINLAGDPEGVIPPVNYKLHYAIAVIVLIMLVAIEVMAGYKLPGSAGDTRTNIAWMLILAAGLTLLAHLAGTNRAIVNANNDAFRTYARKFPGGCLDWEGRTVGVNPVGRSIRIVARWGEYALLLWSAGFTVFFAAVSFQGRAFRPDVLFGAVSMVTLTIAYYLTMIRYAPKYPKGQQEEYEDLAWQLENDCDLAKNLSGPDPDDPYLRDREQAMLQYQKTVENAALEVTNDIASRRSIVSRYLIFNDQYLQAYRLARETFRSLVFETANAVSKRTPGINVEEYDDPRKTEELDRLFKQSITPTLKNAALVEQARQFDPQAAIPEERIVNFAPLENEVIGRVEAEMSGKTGSGLMTFRWKQEADTDID